MMMAEGSERTEGGLEGPEGKYKYELHYIIISK